MVPRGQRKVDRRPFAIAFAFQPNAATVAFERELAARGIEFVPAADGALTLHTSAGELDPVAVFAAAAAAGAAVRHFAPCRVTLEEAFVNRVS